MSRNQTAEGGLIPVVLIAEDHQDIREMTKLFIAYTRRQSLTK